MDLCFVCQAASGEREHIGVAFKSVNGRSEKIAKQEAIFSILTAKLEGNLY